MAANTNWKNDPRIQTMNPEKIRFLEEFAALIQHTPRSQIMNRFLSINAEAQKRGISFSNQETELLTDILLGHMSPADREKLGLLRMLSQKLGQRK